jgi:hypothetical protein
MKFGIGLGLGVESGGKSRSLRDDKQESENRQMQVQKQVLRFAQDDNVYGGPATTEADPCGMTNKKREQANASAKAGPSLCSG